MKRARWIVLIALVAAVIAGALWLARLRGCGPGSGSGFASPGSKSEGPPDSAYFVITVEGSTIRVDGHAVTAEEAVARARKDGRPVMLVWDRAYTDAENALKAELLRRGVEIASEKTRK